MKTLVLSTIALLCLAACAQNPVDPLVPVPAVTYRSVFANTPTGVETQSLDWKRANADVAQFPRGHVDVLKWEQATAPSALPAPSPPSASLRALSAEEAIVIARRYNPSAPVADIRKAWINAVAAQQSALYLRDVKDTAEAGAELARRMARVGNWSRLEQAREQVFLADAAAQLARAHNTAFSAREKLIRLMRPDGAHIGFVLVDRLPNLPRSATELRQLPNQARSEAREAYFGYRTAYDLAVYYRDEIVPLRKFINDELVLRYSGMLASVWELLADTRQQSLSINSAIEAQRDFWLAEADLQTTLQGN